MCWHEPGTAARMARCQAGCRPVSHSSHARLLPHMPPPCVGVCVCVLLQSGGASSEGINLGPIKEGSSADSFLLPEDLVHLTRRSLFLVIDSDNSTTFSKLQVRQPVHGRVA